MSEFEYLRNVTVGQYIPTDSIVHRLDPRTKLLATLLIALAVTTTRSVLATAALIVVVMAVAKLARIDVRYVLRGLLPALPFILILMAMQLLFQGRYSTCDVLYFEWWFIRITPCLVELVILGALRLVVFLFLVSLLTLTTTASHIMHGVESLLAPLQRIGLPVHEFALANIIALRFIPTIAEELERIAKAQASRGGDFGGEKWYRPDRIARARLPLIVPLFVNTLRRAEELVVAMEARGYLGRKGRSKFVELQMQRVDWLALLLCLALWLSIWRLPWPMLNQFAGM
jgi:energy-coupling factor transport system permease protein